MNYINDRVASFYSLYNKKNTIILMKIVMEKPITCSASDKAKINAVMNAVEDLMKKQTALECRKNIWETIRELQDSYPDCHDYIDNLYNELVKKYKIDFFKEIR